jgi:hypothetical protein
MRFRSKPLDAAVRSRLDLQPREHVLAWNNDDGGRAVVASDSGLHLQRVPPDYTRFGWEQIERAAFDAGVLTVVLTPDAGAATLRIPLSEGRDVAVAVRDRVTASVVVDRFVPLAGERGVRVVGRRRSDGVLVWRTDLDSELAGDGWDAGVAHALTEVRAEVGDV